MDLNGPKLSSCAKFSIPLARLLAHALLGVKTQEDGPVWLLVLINSDSC